MSLRRVLEDVAAFEEVSEQGLCGDLAFRRRPTRSRNHDVERRHDGQAEMLRLEILLAPPKHRGELLAEHSRGGFRYTRRHDAHSAVFP